jgi:5'(3')-deoxyribonucleotidase
MHRRKLYIKFELKNKLNSRPVVYVDMDGVLADFFAEYAKLAGVTSGSYRDIPPAKQDPTLDKMVGTDFFRKLPKFPTTDALVNLTLKYVKNYNICSSPLRNDYANSAKWKKVWIRFVSIDPDTHK